MFLIVINSVIDVPPCARCYEVTEHVCRVVREQLSVWLLWGCEYFSTRIFLGGGRVQRMEKVESLALFLLVTVKQQGSLINETNSKTLYDPISWHGY